MNLLYKISVGIIALPNLISAHGAGSYPPSRQWLCSGGATPNLGVGWNGNAGPNICKPDFNLPFGYNMNDVIVNWSGLSQGAAGGFLTDPSYKRDPREKHILAMSMDGTFNSGLKSTVCSGGSNNPKYSAANNPNFSLNLGGFDQMKQGNQNPDHLIVEYPTPLKSGKEYNFEYACSACHKTAGKGYVDSYISKDGIDLLSGKELTWEDFEATPFCRYNSNTGLTDFRSNNFNNFKCTIPEGKLGGHVIFQVWQRDDSPEAFYSCADVMLSHDDSISTTTLASSTTTTKNPETPEIPISSSTWNLIHTDGKIYHNNGDNCLSYNQDFELTLASKKKDCTKWTYLGFNNLKIQNKDLCLSYQISRDNGISLKIADNCDINSDTQHFAYDHESGKVKFGSESFDFCLRQSIEDVTRVSVGFCQVLNSSLENNLRFGRNLE